LNQKLATAIGPRELLVGGRRSQIRMLVSNKLSQWVYDYEFERICDFIFRGDLLIFNRSATLPVEVAYGDIKARYYDFHDKWCRVSSSGRPPQALLGKHGLRYVEEESKVTYGDKRDMLSHLYRLGHAVSDTDQQYPLEYYWSLYSGVPGSAEFPSASRPFTFELVRCLMVKGVQIGFITLHTATNIEDEVPLPEWFEVPYETLDAVDKTRRCGRRVIAVGTTTVRALESVDAGAYGGRAIQGYTSLVVTESHRLKWVDALITGFHDPDSSHMELLRAFHPNQKLEEVYRQAARLGYTKGMFGDLCMLL
jgi:S-adenosylmethionine:tRNA ribosyltransferase-isomerase